MVQVVRACVFLLAMSACGSCWWPFSSSEEPGVEQLEAVGGPGELVERRSTPFEITSAEQKFLAEAQQFLDMSPLDRCQHLVVSRLRDSCGDLDEEELGKLSVALLNCQSQAEGRQTFTCSEHMTLAECTGAMDAHMWNTYHIISNRARSVCYSTRQQQFRRQTELAVNKLSQSTLEQLGAVQELANSHEEIRSMAHESLSTLQSHQLELSERQNEVLASQAGLTENINSNLEQLTQEKAMINLGQQRLANMTESIHQQLEVASSFLETHEELRRQSHSEILNDITDVRENIQNVWERVDNSTSQLLGVMEDISQQYQSTLDNLKLINSSVSSMMSLVVSMDTALSEQLDWLITQLGGTQDGLRILTTCGTHACFLLAATLCILFIKAPGFARITLLVLVVANAVVEVKYGVSLTLSALAALEALVVVCNWTFLWWRAASSKKAFPTPYYLPAPSTPARQASSQQPDGFHATRQPNQTHFPEEVDKFGSTPLSSEDESDEDDMGGYNTGYNARPVVDAPIFAETLTHTPTKHTPHTPTRLTTFTPFTPSPRSAVAAGGRQCVSRTKSGLQCKLGATAGSLHCRHHGNH